MSYWRIKNTSCFCVISFHSHQTFLPYLRLKGHEFTFACPLNFEKEAAKEKNSNEYGCLQLRNCRQLLLLRSSVISQSLTAVWLWVWGKTKLYRCRQCLKAFFKTIQRLCVYIKWCWTYLVTLITYSMTVISYTINKSNILYLSMYFDLTGHVSLPGK